MTLFRQRISSLELTLVLYDQLKLQTDCRAIVQTFNYLHVRSNKGLFFPIMQYGQILHFFYNITNNFFSSNCVDFSFFNQICLANRKPVKAGFLQFPCTSATSLLSDFLWKTVSGLDGCALQLTAGLYYCEVFEQAVQYGADEAPLYFSNNHRAHRNLTTAPQRLQLLAALRGQKRRDAIKPPVASFDMKPFSTSNTHKVIQCKRVCKHCNWTPLIICVNLM